MDRRRFLLASLAGALASPPVTRAQEAGRIYRLGYLATTSGPTDWERAFVEAMRDLGYVSGRNLLIEYRWGAGRNDRLAKLATELVDLRPDLIIASPTPRVLAAKDATKSIPIVFPISVDAVEAGVVDSLARPRGNVTGLTLMSADLIGKRLDLLRVMLPKASRLAFLSISGIPKITDPLVRELETKGRAIGISVRLYEVPSFGDAEAVDRALETIRRDGPDALYILESPSMAARAPHVMSVALKHRVPVLAERVRTGRRAVVLRTRWHSHASASRHLRRQDPSRGQAGRSSRRATDTVRARRQREDCQGPRPHDPDAASPAGESGD